MAFSLALRSSDNSRVKVTAITFQVRLRLSSLPPSQSTSPFSSPLSLQTPFAVDFFRKPGLSPKEINTKSQRCRDAKKENVLTLRAFASLRLGVNIPPQWVPRERWVTAFHWPV